MRHLLGLEGLDAGVLTTLLDRADGLVAAFSQPNKKVERLRGRTVLNVFYEASTRTRVSFELAAKRLGADAVNLTAAASSVQKGESLRDTARSLDAMHADALVLRHPRSGAAAFIAPYVRAQVINAGDGTHEHPTQGLLDLLTMRRHFGGIKGLRVAIVGDILHSRVARSNLYGLLTLGAEVRLAGPRPLLPAAARLTAFAPAACTSLTAALEGADVVMALRLQQERMASGLLPSLREYAEEFGISAARLRLAQPTAILMHPGPVQRGVELADDVVDAERSLILPQVEHGVAVRAAVLEHLLENPEGSR
jgi:aspartate carbamoyltransferase catalytic subunit